MSDSQELETKSYWRRVLNIAKSPRTLELLAWPSDVEKVPILDVRQYLTPRLDDQLPFTCPKSFRIQVSSALSGKLVT